MANTDFDTLIGEKTQLTGDIEFSGGLHIDGRVEGTIRSRDMDHGLLVISEKGVVNGEVQVPSVVIDGRLEGNVTAQQRLELRENAVVDGDVRYGTIRMEMGAQVNGTLSAESGAKKSGSSAPTSPEKGAKS